MARILIIDDEKLIRTALHHLLERMGHSVIDAADGAEGLHICTGQDIDLVITDIYMPLVNGLETIATLRRWGLHTPILAMSGGLPGRGGLDVLALALRQGANMALAKPYATEELLSAVTRLLAGSLLGQAAPREPERAAAELKPRHWPRDGN